MTFEPLDFSIEKFDGLGGFHERDESGNALRDDGEILFPGGAEARSHHCESAVIVFLGSLMPDRYD